MIYYYSGNDNTDVPLEMIQIPGIYAANGTATNLISLKNHLNKQFLDFDIV